MLTTIFFQDKGHIQAFLFLSNLPCFTFHKNNEAGSENMNYIKGFFEAVSWYTFVIKDNKMNVPQVASSIKFWADSSPKQGIHYLDYCIVPRHKELVLVFICFFLIKTHLQCAFLEFQ